MELNERQVIIPDGMDLNHASDEVQDGQNKHLQEPEAPRPIDTVYKVKEWLRLAKIDPNEKIDKPPVCLSLIGENHDGIIGTLGNFSLIIGKAKSKKTFSIALFLSALVANKTVFGKFKGSLPDGKEKVVFFDTEQSRYHVQKFYHRVCQLLEIKNPVNFEAYCLRQFKPSERLEIIDEYIKSESDLGFMAIDGIRDLVTSINDEDEATKIASYLLKWTEQKNIHIVTVLHQNKRDENARGHVGTELVNKAETVLSVSIDPQDKNVSVVEPEFCRDMEPDIFAFTVNEFGLPELMDDWEKVEKKSKRQSPDSISSDYHKEKLREIFKRLGNEIKGGELVDCINTEFDIGKSKSIQFRTFYLSQKWIIRNGHQNSPKSFYTLNI